MATANNDDNTTSSRDNGEKLQIWEYPTSESADYRKYGVLYEESSDNDDQWNKIQPSSIDKASDVPKEQSPMMEAMTKEVLSFFLPAQYPKSVAPGYARFAAYSFTASVAGSAAMVLSTQTLLLAVGVVGSNVQHAGIMAGAFNWVMKDFVGQLGGVLFASQMGKTRAFDTDPKRWRMVAAMVLDGATLLEILSPLFPSSMVLPVASFANVGKNIGFLTASASRASLHQAIAITGNLGDVTAKAGSQSIMASLIGTSLGIGMSSLLSHDTYNFALGFCFLGLVHQGCNFLSLQSVPLTYFNRQRLHILLERYMEDSTIMNPMDVAKKESYFPLYSVDADTKSWLSIGAEPLESLCPTPMTLREALSAQTTWTVKEGEHESNPQYLIRAMPDGHVHLMFFQTSTGDDMIRGMYHACILRKKFVTSASPESNNDSKKAQSETEFKALLEQIHLQGWKTETEITTLEHGDSRRLVWKED